MPKVLKSPSSIQEIEIEVAEVLYGLTRQFQVPAKEDSDKLHCKDDLERRNDSSFSHPPASSNGSASHGRDLLVASLPVSSQHSFLCLRKQFSVITEIHLPLYFQHQRGRNLGVIMLRFIQVPLFLLFRRQLMGFRPEFKPILGRRMRSP